MFAARASIQHECGREIIDIFFNEGLLVIILHQHSIRPALLFKFHKMRVIEIP